MVLLKNDGRLLPLDASKLRKILVCGPAAETVPFGGGSGAVRPAFQVTPLAGLKSALGDRIQTVQATDRAAMLEAARAADVVVFFAKDEGHGEGTDLKTMDLPEGQAELIAALTAANAKVVVVLLAGQPVSLEPWAERVPAILAAWYAGQSTGDAIADVLTGKVNPGGKLSFTFGKRLEDYACHSLGLWPPRPVLEPAPVDPGWTPQERKAIYGYAADYKEGVFMGYRWFDEKGIEPRFPFGHGLSYTTFTFQNLQVEHTGGSVRVFCTVRNTGDRAGAEVVQIYVAPPPSSVPRPPRELKGFRKVFLKPGESVRAEVQLRPSALAFYDAAAKSWIADPGTYQILVGSSSRKIHLTAKVELPKQRLLARF